MVLAGASLYIIGGVSGGKQLAQDAWKLDLAPSGAHLIPPWHALIIVLLIRSCALVRPCCVREIGHAAAASAGSGMLHFPAKVAAWPAGSSAERTECHRCPAGSQVPSPAVPSQAALPAAAAAAAPIAPAAAAPSAASGGMDAGAGWRSSKRSRATEAAGGPGSKRQRAAAGAGSGKAAAGAAPPPAAARAAGSAAAPPAAGVAANAQEARELFDAAMQRIEALTGKLAVANSEAAVLAQHKVGGHGARLCTGWKMGGREPKNLLAQPAPTCSAAARST